MDTYRHKKGEDEIILQAVKKDGRIEGVRFSMSTDYMATNDYAMWMSGVSSIRPGDRPLGDDSIAQKVKTENPDESGRYRYFYEPGSVDIIVKKDGTVSAAFKDRDGAQGAEVAFGKGVKVASSPTGQFNHAGMPQIFLPKQEPGQAMDREVSYVSMPSRIQEGAALDLGVRMTGRKAEIQESFEITDVKEINGETVFSARVLDPSKPSCVITGYFNHHSGYMDIYRGQGFEKLAEGPAADRDSLAAPATGRNSGVPLHFEIFKPI